MLIMCFIGSIALAIIGFIVLCCTLGKNSLIGVQLFGMLMIIGAIPGGILSGFSIANCVQKINQAASLQASIYILEEENADMNEEIKNTVMMTLNTESELYKKFAESQNTDSTVKLVLEYPELQSIALVDKYIDIYKSNQDEIKNKRLELAEVETARRRLHSFSQDSDDIPYYTPKNNTTNKGKSDTTTGVKYNQENNYESSDSINNTPDNNDENLPEWWIKLRKEGFAIDATK